MSVYSKVCMSITGKGTYVESEDSDYEPPIKLRNCRRNVDLEAKQPQRGKKRQKKKVASKESNPYNIEKRRKPHKGATYSRDTYDTRNPVRNLHRSDGTKESCDKTPSPWELLPTEIISKIFGYVVSEEGSALPCLKNLGGVCKHWSSVANIPHLWTHMSFSPRLIPSEKEFKANYKDRDIVLSQKLQYTYAYDFARLCMVAPKIIGLASDRSKEIKDLSVEDCVIGSALSLLVRKHGRNIQNISIKRCKIVPAEWRKCLSEFGENLKSMEVISQDYCQRHRLCMKSLNHLRNVTELKMQYIGDFDLCFIKDLTMLQTLHLKDTSVRLGNVNEFDHPKLEDVDLSFETKVSHGHDALVEMLHNCNELRKLSLRGRYVSIDVLCSNLRLCNRIAYLDVSVIDSGRSHNSIGSLLNTIGPSLRELHIDKYINLEESLKMGDQYRSAWQPLQIVSMQNTNIQAHTLLSYLMDSLREMKILNVSTCRELPRGCKRSWSDRKSLEVLLKRSLSRW